MDARENFFSYLEYISKESYQTIWQLSAKSTSIQQREKNMGTEDRVEATAENLQGKAQEALGNITGDPKDKAEGQAKQVDAQAQHAKEDIKDEVKKAVE
jgi:uncharacterized protein YjbJ (UPF0337 family)